MYNVLVILSKLLSREYCSIVDIDLNIKHYTI